MVTITSVATTPTSASADKSIETTSSAGAEAEGIPTPGRSVSTDRKQQKTAFMAMVDEFLCPITLALPFDPVVAEDGRVYERKAIEKHIRLSRRNGGIKSPITNEPMGPNILASLQIKNAIEKAIDSGKLDEEISKPWKVQRVAKLELEALKKKALAGDGDSAARVAWLYRESLPADQAWNEYMDETQI